MRNEARPTAREGRTGRAPRSILCVVIATGCASYGWADRPGAHVTAEPVAVRTVAVDASSGADAAYLTRALVESLHRAGLVQATWTTATEVSGIVQCDVAVRDEASFGDAMHVRASARCFVDGAPTGEDEGDMLLAANTSRRLDDRARAAEAASIEALDAAAADVAAHFASRESAR